MGIEGYNSIPEDAKEIEELDKSYLEETTINGKVISVGWDEGYNDYTIYFPQINIGDEAREKGVYDQVIRISQNPKIAKEVFDFASKLAQTESDIYIIYKKVEEFSRDLGLEE